MIHFIPVDFEVYSNILPLDNIFTNIIISIFSEQWPFKQDLFLLALCMPQLHSKCHKIVTCVCFMQRKVPYLSQKLKLKNQLDKMLKKAALSLVETKIR